jgi:tRNA(Arg) A34 adenosine deaminase TadA
MARSIAGAQRACACAGALSFAHFRSLRFAIDETSGRVGHQLRAHCDARAHHSEEVALGTSGLEVRWDFSSVGLEHRAYPQKNL